MPWGCIRVRLPVAFSARGGQNTRDKGAVFRSPFFHTVQMLLVAACVSAATAWAATADQAGGVAAVPLPGGLRAVMAASGDDVPADRSQFLLELIRRLYDTPIGNRNDPREALLRAVVASLRDAPMVPRDTVPLPLSTRMWTTVVFQGRATA